MSVPLPNPPNRSSLWGHFANWVVECLRRVTVQSTPTIKASYTTQGIFLDVQGGRRAGGAGSIPEIDQWDPETDYAPFDLAFADTVAEQDDGTQDGLYQCISAIPGDAGNDEPSVDTAHWRMVARGHWEVQTMRREDQQIQFSVSRDGATDPYIKIWLDKDDEEAGCVLLDVQDLIDLTTGDNPIPAGTGNLVVKLRMTTGSDPDTGLCKRAVFLRSQWFD